MAHGHGHHGQILGEDAGALGVGQQVHPAVFVTGGVVVAQRDLALEAVVVQGGQHAQLDQKLEAVTDAQDQFAVVDEFGQGLEQGSARAVLQIAPAHAGSLGGTQVVTIQEPAGEHEKMVIAQADFGGHDVGKVHDVSAVGTRETGGVGGFEMGIGAIAGDDESIDCAHAAEASLQAVATKGHYRNGKRDYLQSL